MKKNILAALLQVFAAIPLLSQNVAINNDQSLPNPNAMLDVKSGTRGMLIPRMDSSARKAIPNTKGLLVYDTTSNSFWFNTGLAWQSLPNTTGWSTVGNGGTTDGVQFIGTTDAAPLTIKVNNFVSGRIEPNTENLLLGYQVGTANTTGFFNTGIGYRSLFSNTTGLTNTAVGAKSLSSNTTGFDNVAIGATALTANTSGLGNTAVGYLSMLNNTTGGINTAIGNAALSPFAVLPKPVELNAKASDPVAVLE